MPNAQRIAIAQKKRPAARVRASILQTKRLHANSHAVYGDCGVGAFCLGGCDPLMSNTFDSCVPGPVCKPGTYSLDSLNDVQRIENYLGDASKINWQSQGDPTPYTDPATGSKATLLTMAQGSSGTLLASTHYVWYGKICSKVSSAQGKGVVTAFILMSDVKDEIDFEWVGADINNVQSNYYSQGVTVCEFSPLPFVRLRKMKLTNTRHQWQKPDGPQWQRSREGAQVLYRLDRGHTHLVRR